GFITMRRSACRWRGLGKVTKPKQPWGDRAKAAHGFSVLKGHGGEKPWPFFSRGMYDYCHEEPRNGKADRECDCLD
ncbi:MAG TPA: hypothetical protein PLY20_07010, partial [Smithellaceae bacterium]|nr:hypothetical protein [Smithellaceae bacterium]HQN67686.1 hypothetical protein [Smithellaceae bacterium]